MFGSRLSLEPESISAHLGERNLIRRNTWEFVRIFDRSVVDRYQISNEAMSRYALLDMVSLHQALKPQP